MKTTQIAILIALASIVGCKTSTSPEPLGTSKEAKIERVSSKIEHGTTTKPPRRDASDRSASPGVGAIGSFKEQCFEDCGFGSLPPLKPCASDDELCQEVERAGGFSIGWLEQGTSASIMLEKLGEPDQKGARVKDATSGEIYEPWVWEAAGVRADMLALTMASPVLHAEHFTVMTPYDGKTPKGIGIGSTEADVLAAYEGSFDPHFSVPGTWLVAGSTSRGIFFDIKDGRVTKIFIGSITD